MPYEQFANNAATTLSAGCTNVATSISVTSSTPFPTATNGGQFRVLIGTELLIVTAISGTTWTVTRGAEGTTAAAHSSGDAVTHIITKDSLYQFGLGGGDYFRSGYYSYGTFGNPNSTATLSTGTMFIRPFTVPVRRTFDQIGINVSTAATAGGVIRMGIYTGSGVPTTLLLDAGTVASTATGAVSISISQTLEPGVYWLACVGQTAQSTVTAFAALSSPWASPSTTNNGAAAAAYTVNTVTGSLPSSPSASGQNTVPAIGLRAA